MKILFVYPKYPDTFWSYKHALRFVSKKAAIPPLGLLTVAAMVPDAWEKRLVDLNTSKLSNEQIKWADMVFISAMIVQKPSVQEVISRCKALGKTIVAGGPAFTAQPEQYPDVTHLVLNEAEVTLPMFLSDLAQGKATIVKALGLQESRRWARDMTEKAVGLLPAENGFRTENLKELALSMLERVA